MSEAVDPRRMSNEELVQRLHAVQTTLHETERAIAAGEPTLSRGEMRGLISDCNLMLVEARKRGLRMT